MFFLSTLEASRMKTVYFRVYFHFRAFGVFPNVEEIAAPQSSKELIYSDPPASYDCSHLSDDLSDAEKSSFSQIIIKPQIEQEFGRVLVTDMQTPPPPQKWWKLSERCGMC